MASKAAEIQLPRTRAARRRRTNGLERFRSALKAWGQRGQLTGYAETQLSRQTGSRI
jgi:hypothetical protein